MSKALVKELKKRFRILDGWTITMGSDKRLDGTPYTEECTVDMNQHTAVIYPWLINEQEPSDYLLHEILHIALRVASIDREREELFTQDLCTNLKGGLENE